MVHVDSPQKYLIQILAWFNQAQNIHFSQEIPLLEQVLTVSIIFSGKYDSFSSDNTKDDNTEMFVKC